jgi:sugar lactone lactonase YvrE
MIDIEVFSRGNDHVGEGPLWSAIEQSLYWIDIGRKYLYRKGPSDSRPRSWALPDHPGCLAELVPGRIAVAMDDGMQQLDLHSGAIDLLQAAPARRPNTRFNDGKVDPRGRLWVGTMQNNFGPNGSEVSIERFDGALYRFDTDGCVVILEEAVGIANTLAWSPDLTRFYFGDSLKGALFVYDFDADSGEISAKRAFYEVSGTGIPDGSAIDVDGCLWNARWDGGAILKITPQGKLDRTIRVPVPRPTSCAFGGPDLKTLYVTSATDGLNAAQLEHAPLSGSVFEIHGVGQGVAVPPLTIK